jgi:peptidoglycan hydrolase-like protein with peptidoglycan-binding domain
MRARVVAPILAAVLGIGGGMTTALVVPDDDSAGPSSFSDPLHLGRALVDLDCTGDAILIVGYGAGASSLGAAVANNGKSVRYLRTDDSCPTLLGPEDVAGDGDEEQPEYVAYLGPYEGRIEPCALRMTAAHRGDFVSVLKSGNTQNVKCVCELGAKGAPELRPGMDASADDQVWIRALQWMFVDVKPDEFPRSNVTHVYDPATRAVVTGFQERAGLAGERGVVDAATWELLTDRICGIYTY